MKTSLFNNKNTFEKDDEDQWIISYADMISAILAVLLMFFSFTKLDIQKIDSMQRASSQNKTIDSLETLAHKIEVVAIESKLTKEVKVVLDDTGLKVHFQNVAWFDTGSSMIDSRKVDKFLPILEIITNSSKRRLIDIEGHTDDSLNPKAPKTFNWELSSKRALSLFTFLKEVGLNDRNVRIVSYADTKPIEPYINFQGHALEVARSKNRRVSIFIKEVNNFERTE